MDASQVIELAKIAGPICDPNKPGFRLLYPVYKAIKNEKGDDRIQRNAEKAIRLANKQGIDLVKITDSIVASENARNTRVKVIFDTYEQYCDARKTRNLGKDWDENGKIAAYEYQQPRQG